MSWCKIRRAIACSPADYQQATVWAVAQLSDSTRHDISEFSQYSSDAPDIVSFRENLGQASLLNRVRPLLAGTATLSATFSSFRSQTIAITASSRQPAAIAAIRMQVIPYTPIHIFIWLLSIHPACHLAQTLMYISPSALCRVLLGARGFGARLAEGMCSANAHFWELRTPERHWRYPNLSHLVISRQQSAPHAILMLLGAAMQAAVELDDGYIYTPGVGRILGASREPLDIVNTPQLLQFDSSVPSAIMMEPWGDAELLLNHWAAVSVSIESKSSCVPAGQSPAVDREQVSCIYTFSPFSLHLNMKARE